MTLDTYSADELVDLVQTVRRELGAEPHESLSQAAFRVSRLNIAPLRALEVARRVLAAQGTSPRAQWAALDQCVELIRRHVRATPPTPPPTPPTKG